MEKALHGIRVLDFSRAKAGPTCGQILADMGADVIRVEKPGGDFDRSLGPYTPDRRSLYLMFTCRNKRGITLNLMEEKGKEMLKKLVKVSDIVIEAFGHPTNKELGLDYDSLKQIKADIIVAAISGYGQYGPYRDRLGFDGLAQGISGLMWVTGFPQGLPVKAGVSFVDTSTGVYTALGISLALYYREKSGKGQLVDVALSDTAVSFMESTMAEYQVLNEIRPQIGNASVLVAPYDAYKAKDGWVFLGASGDAMWKRLLKVTGREGLADDPRFATEYDRTRPENRQFLTEWLGGWVSESTVDEAIRQLNEAGIPCGRINTIPEAASEPHIRARDMIVELEHPGVGKVPLIGIPIKLSETPGEIKTPAPELGQHNEEVYCGLLGLSRDQLSQLREEGII